MSPNCKKYFASVVMSGLVAVVAPAAHATLLLSGSINGTDFCAADQNVGCGFGGVILDDNPHSTDWVWTRSKSRRSGV
jgi:hypothetical protein